MHRIQGSIKLSATDLIGYLNCHHLAELNLEVVDGKRPEPNGWDPTLQFLSELGLLHEQDYVEHLIETGLDVVRLNGVDNFDEAISETLVAMQRGSQAIVQGALSHDRWYGRTDVLLRVDSPSKFGDWSYEVAETKLTRETKAGAVLQLCLYSDLLTSIQNAEPEHLYVITPWSNYEPQRYRFADFSAYFRKAKLNYVTALAERGAETYPEPKDHCEICKWRTTCDKRRRDDDHLCLVSGISKLQTNELNRQGIATLRDLANMPLPLEWQPVRGSAESYSRIRDQARVQFEARETGKNKFELLPIEDGFGLTRLPEPSDGDIFFDLEASQFVGEHGLEYLFGYYVKNDVEPAYYEYHCDWAFTRSEEKQTFEQFVDFVMERWELYPDFHIYHYAPYEPSALKRLMGRYATREDEIDQMLRAGVFVDLYQIVRQSIRASVESYSIKHLEKFYEYEREAGLTEANAALFRLQTSLEFGDVSSIKPETKSTVRAYNRDDCISTLALRNWLETLRASLINDGTNVPRPSFGDATPSEILTEKQKRVLAIAGELTHDIPIAPEDRDREQQARWILANLLEWHRREVKATWWEYFRLADLSAEDLLEERAGLSVLEFGGNVGGTSAAPIHRYKFPPQETDLRGGEALCNVGGNKLGKVEEISFENFTVDIKKRMDAATIHPQAVFVHDFVDSNVIADSILRIGEHVAMHGMEGGGNFVAARDLLLRKLPRVDEQKLQREGETTLESAIRLCKYLTQGILAIQGPPGAGKTFTGASMICELVKQNKTVGVTANSHKVIRNLLDSTIKIANELQIDVRCCHKAAEAEQSQPNIDIVTKNVEFFRALERHASVGGGTAWLWSREEAFQKADVLFVDEAAQMSLANVLAISQAANTVVLIGDPQQLDQPMKGSHPDGTDISALNHILEEQKTISPDKGLFLKETWRLHPEICEYTSGIFYDNKLKSKAGLEIQIVNSEGLIDGSGLRYLPVEHTGNRNSSPEEAEAIKDLVNDIMTNNTTWVNFEGEEHAIELNDIVIITPYNAQVFEIQKHIPGVRVGTVDKFQGQEAPIAIYSMATSSFADAPRGMEFLYSLNRLNVATSRAKSISIIVSSPQIFEAECRNPQQMQLANAFCRFLELAGNLEL